MTPISTLHESERDLTKKMSVLVVEDNPIIRHAEKVILVNAGYNVIEARSVATGLMHLDAQDLAAIVLDLHLPNGSGARIVDELIAKRDDVPVIVVSAFHGEIEVGFPVVALLPKPIKREDLIPAVHEAHKQALAIRSLRNTTRQLRDAREATERRQKPENPKNM